MASLPNPPFVPVDEYLNSRYHPDLEYVDGVLVERSVPGFAHGVPQIILGCYFYPYGEDFGFVAASEVRTRFIARARYRIPDVMLCPAPITEGVCTVVPWVIIEILSPEDSVPAQLARFADYRRIGVRHLVLLDPERLEAFRFADGALLTEKFTSLDLPTGSLPFDTDALFDRLVKDRNRGRL